MAHQLPLNRRQLLARAGGGAGLLALAAMLAEEGLLIPAATGAESGAADPRLNPLAPKQSHFPAKAKSVIWLFMNGGPSQVDTWDYKPELEKRDGKELEGFDKNTGFFTGQVGPVMKSPFKFAQHGQVRAPGSARSFPRWPSTSTRWRSSTPATPTRTTTRPALFMMNTGTTRMGYPCVGSWVTYGLGSESLNLPAFVAMTDPLGRGLPKGYSQNWGAGFLPSVYQGTWLKPQGDPIDNLYRPKDQTRAQQRAAARSAGQAQQAHAGSRSPHELELAARIESFELAYRMQMAAPEAIDIDHEPEHIHKLYGIDDKRCDHFARQCLIARRMVERGVRFVQIYSRRHGERAELGRPPEHQGQPHAVRRRDRHAHRRPARRPQAARPAR